MRASEKGFRGWCRRWKVVDLGSRVTWRPPCKGDTDEKHCIDEGWVRPALGVGILKPAEETLRQYRATKPLRAGEENADATDDEEDSKITSEVCIVDV